METEQAGRAGTTAGEVSIAVVTSAKETTMKNITTLTRTEAWFRRGAAGLTALIAVGALAAGLAGGLQWNERRSLATAPTSGEVAAAVPETGVGPGAMKAASEQYRTLYDATFAARRGTAAMKDASAEYRAMYDRSFVVPGSMVAITASSAEYRAMYDATWAGSNR